jgi:hypothetical protein
VISLLIVANDFSYRSFIGDPFIDLMEAICFKNVKMILFCIVAQLQ